MENEIGRHAIPLPGSASYDMSIMGLFLEADIVVKIVIVVLIWRPSGPGRSFRKGGI